MAIVLAVGAIGALLGDALTANGEVTTQTESKRAYSLIDKRLPNPQYVDEVIVVRSPRFTVDDPQFGRFIRRLAEQGRRGGVVADARSYFGTHDRKLVSRDGHATLVLDGSERRQPDCPADRPGCRSSCSPCSSACRWTTTSSCSAGSAETYLRTGRTSEAVASAVSTTARLITGAALIIVAVVAGFARGDLVPFQQMGFGVAVSLLIDATLIRSVLLPASMQLLGRWNWYLPRWLGWLPELQVEGG